MTGNEKGEKMRVSDNLSVRMWRLERESGQQDRQIRYSPALCLQIPISVFRKFRIRTDNRDSSFLMEERASYYGSEP